MLGERDYRAGGHEQPEPFLDSLVILLMAQNQPKRKKNELRDALLVSLALAVTMFSLAMLMRTHLWPS
jgi:hypothetical protein